MYAIVDIAGQQFRVKENQRVKVPLLKIDSGKTVKFDRVLAIGDDSGGLQTGKDVEKSVVSATVLEHGRHKKVIVFKKKRRKGYQKKNGHRQDFSLIQINKIGADGKVTDKVEKTEKPKAAAKTEKPATKKAAEVKKETKAPKTAAKKPAAKKDTVKSAARPAAKNNGT